MKQFGVYLHQMLSSGEIIFCSGAEDEDSLIFIVYGANQHRCIATEAAWPNKGPKANICFLLLSLA